MCYNLFWVTNIIRTKNIFTKIIIVEVFFLFTISYKQNVLKVFNIKFSNVCVTYNRVYVVIKSVKKVYLGHEKKRKSVNKSSISNYIYQKCISCDNFRKGTNFYSVNISNAPTWYTRKFSFRRV